jgi:predicted PurR-regulated permease PerM
MANLGQTLVTRTLAGIPGFFTVVVYVVLVPIIVFFLLKDRRRSRNWLAAFLPDKRPLLDRIWAEMNVQFSNYARGKMVEIIIVGAVSYVLSLLRPALCGAAGPARGAVGDHSLHRRFHRNGAGGRRGASSSGA